MRILVCGGRDYPNREKLFVILDVWHHSYPDLVIIQGAARGADSFAGQWAKYRGVPQEIFPADWDKHGKSAGFKRNRQMLEEGRPNLVLAFAGGRGTAMMVDIAEKAGVSVWKYS
jgi:hypothetical protein